MAVSAKGDRAMGESGNKPSCLECGNTDRFMAQCPIRIDKTKRWTNNPPSYTKKGEKERNYEMAKL